MKSIKLYVGHILVLSMILCLIACSDKSKKESMSIEQYGAIQGMIRCSIGSQGFKVSLTNISSGQLLHTIVTDNDGTFVINDIPSGQYYINAEKDNCNWAWMTVNGSINTSDQKIYIDGNKTLDIIIQMQVDPSYFQNELTITDIYGNPIGDEITIQQYSSMIVIKLINETIQDFSWDLTKYYCIISGYRDTIVGDYQGFTYHTYDLFSNISPTSGTLGPSNDVVITGFINPEIYTLDRLDNFSLSHYPMITLYMNNKRRDISLYLPFFYK